MTTLKHVCFWLCAFTLSEAHALPGYISLVPTDQGCVTCHMDRNGGGIRNAFGAQYESFGFFERRWTTLCTLDADGDGYTNGEELGDPDCAWRLLTPPPGAISNPSDPSSLPSLPPANAEADDEAGIPSRQTNSVPVPPGSNGFDDSDTDDGDDAQNNSAGRWDDNGVEQGSDAASDEEASDPETPTQSQLIPIDPNQDSAANTSVRPPLGSPESGFVDSESDESNDYANSGCSAANANANPPWPLILVACVFTVIRRRYRQATQR